MLKKLIKRYVEYKTKRVLINQSIRELSSLTDKELNDIGITRAQIPYVVMEGKKSGKESIKREATKVS